MGAKFRRQHPLGPYVLDFFCVETGLIIECDGAPHFPRPRKDVIRDAWFHQQGYSILRFNNSCILKKTDFVLEIIRRELASRLWANPPLPPGRGGRG
jgi:very-short-patch-repair endonuclease